MPHEAQQVKFKQGQSVYSAVGHTGGHHYLGLLITVQEVLTWDGIRCTPCRLQLGLGPTVTAHCHFIQEKAVPNHQRELATFKIGTQAVLTCLRASAGS